MHGNASNQALPIMADRPKSLGLRVFTVSLLTFLAPVLLASCDGNLFKHVKKKAEVAPGEAQLIGDAGSCSLNTPAKWQDFLERSAADSRWVENCEDSECNAPYYALVKERTQKVFEQCASLIQANPAIAACTKNFRRFVPAWMHQHDKGSYGFNLDNHAYLTAQDGANQPKDMMKVPQPIIDAMPSRSKVEEAARVNGWQYLTHDSALGNTRTFIYIADPAGQFDQWMLLNLADNTGEADLSIAFSFIAVQKTDGAGKKFDRVKLNFRDYNITVSNNGKYGMELVEDRSGKCYACHASGVRKLIDRRTTTTAAKPVKGEADFDATGSKPAPDDFGFKRVEGFNTILAAYGMPDWDGMIDPADHGPALGEAQGCTACHDGKNRGAITVSSSLSQLEHKMSAQLSMPPEEGLVKLLEKSERTPTAMSAEENAKLEAAKYSHDDLTYAVIDSRYLALHDWLLEKSCQ